MEKITKREMFVFIETLVDEGMIQFPENDKGIDADAVITFCSNEIEQLDKKAMKAKERAATKAKAHDALTDLVYDTLDENEFQTIAEVTLAVAEENEDITPAKVQYRLTQLVKAEKAEKQEVSIPATETSKARKVMGYRLAQAK